jgi:hypothetical protein
VLSTKTPSYPKYVPEKVSLWTERVLRGGDDPGAEDDDGLIGVLNRLQTRSNRLQRLLKNPGSAPKAYLQDIRRERLALSEQINSVKEEISCLERLTIHPDPDLEDAYKRLKKSLHDDEQIWNFIRAAVSANIKFSPYRDALKFALEHKQTVADLAKALATELEWFNQVGIETPASFWSIRSLLEDANSTNNLAEWRQTRKHLLGEPFVLDEDTPPAHECDDQIDDHYEEIDEDELEVVEIEKGVSVAPEIEDEISNAWTVAPSLSDMLNTLSKAASDFKPREQYFIGAATSSREDSVKSAYIRAFAHLLKANGIPLLQAPKNAMAKMATVALNDPSLVVTYHDVKYALS